MIGNDDDNDDENFKEIENDATTRKIRYLLWFQLKTNRSDYSRDGAPTNTVKTTPFFS